MDVGEEGEYAARKAGGEAEGGEQLGVCKNAKEKKKTPGLGKTRGKDQNTQPGFR